MADLISIHKGLRPFDAEDKVLRFTVRRSHILQDTMRKLGKVKNVAAMEWPVQVSFVGEPAVDEGGPRREFFT